MRIVTSDKMAKSRKRKSAIWEFFDEPIQEEGNEKTKNKRYRVKCMMFN